MKIDTRFCGIQQISFNVWIALFTLAVGLPDIGHANWGGSVFGNTESGDFTAIGTTQIEMQKEHLHIRLFIEHAEVKVEYVLHNTGAGVIVKAGFPGERLVAQGTNDGDIFDYRIEADGQELKWKYRKRKGQPRKGTDDNFLQYVPYWLVSELEFAAGQTRRVKISYKTFFPFFQGGASDDTTYEDAEFVYRLSTGAVWKGPIAKGEVVVEAVGIDPTEMKWPKDKRFVQKGKTFTWTFENLEPKPKSDLRFPVRRKYWRYGVYGRGLRGYYESRDEKWYFVDKSYDATATSSLNPKRYPPNNVRGGRHTAWCEGVKGAGIGERLTLTLKEPKSIKAIGILPGYHKSLKIYRANNRISRIKITIDGGKTREVSFGDEFLQESSIRIPINVSKPIRRVVFEIIAVYKGSKYEDTCISSVELYQPLPRAPKTYGSR